LKCKANYTIKPRVRRSYHVSSAAATIATARLVIAERQFILTPSLVAPKPELATGAGVNVAVLELLVEVLVFIVVADWPVVIGEEFTLDEAPPAPAEVLDALLLFEEELAVPELEPPEVIVADDPVDDPPVPDDDPLDAPPTITPAPVVVVVTDVEVTNVVEVEVGAAVSLPDGAVMKMVELGL
jgi:hypothetical protein